MSSKLTRRISATVLAGLVALALGLSVPGSAAHAQDSKADATDWHTVLVILLGKIAASSDP